MPDALLLSLDHYDTNQVVLEVLEDNVKRGSMVYETGHFLILSLADNQRDQEVIWKILSQVGSSFCAASFKASIRGLLNKGCDQAEGREVPYYFRSRADILITFCNQTKDAGLQR